MHRSRVKLYKQRLYEFLNLHLNLVIFVEIFFLIYASLLYKRTVLETEIYFQLYPYCILYTCRMIYGARKRVQVERMKSFIYYII